MSGTTTPMLNWAWTRDPSTGDVHRICAKCAMNLIEGGHIVPVLKFIEGRYRLVLEPGTGRTRADMMRAAGHDASHLN